MEVCNCHTRNMSFLDEIFGTDGRKHKDEGIWNWVKNQRNKRKYKKAEQQLLQQQQQQSAALHLHNHHASAVPSQNTYSSASNNTEFNNTHTRSHSVSSAATSTTLYYCSPRSPTSTFTPSTTAASSPPSTGYSSPRDSLYFRRPASVNSYTSTATSPSTLLDGSGSSPKTYRLPYTHSRQRAQSTFTFPAPGATGTTVDSTKRYVSSRQQRPQYYYADDYSHSHNPNQNHNLHSHHVHEFYDDEEGPIRRSASSRSAPIHYTHSRPQPSQQQDERQQEEEGDSLNLCDIDSLSLSVSSSNSSSSSSGCSNKGRGVQRDQEEAMGDITEVENDDDENDEYSVVMDSYLSPSSNINSHPLRRAATVTADGSHGNGVSSVAAVARRRRSESTNSFHHKQEDGWWWE